MFYSGFQLDSHFVRIKRREWGEFSTPVGDASLVPPSYRFSFVC